MALKDWIKSNSWRTGFSYRNKHNDDYFIQFYKHSSFDPPFRFTINRDGKFVDDKQFQTRKEGLKYAKEYMKEND